MNQLILDDFNFKNPLGDKYWIYEAKNKMKKQEMEKFDVTKYVGTKTQIAKAEVKRTKFGLAIVVETMPLTLIDGDTMPEGKILRASTMLSIIENPDGTQAIGNGSKADNFLKAHKISAEKIPETLNEGDLIKAFDNVFVICQKNDKGFLTIA